MLSTGLSKKVLETLPFPFLERIYGRLWESFPGAQSTTTPLDQWLTLYLLLEELSEFNPAEWVRQEIQLLGTQEAGAMHGYYYQGELNREETRTFLSRYGYRTDFLDARNAADSLRVLYLVCRRLTRPLPWSALLNGMTDAELTALPRLRRLKLIESNLTESPRTAREISPENLGIAMTLLSEKLHSKQLSTIASDVQVPRPTQALVLVEGETERILLPLFAEAAGLDFNALGIGIWPVGGKNQVLSVYRENARNLEIPICVVLDSDAANIAAELRTMLRQDDKPGDVVFEIAEGEFEDIYDLALMLKVINTVYQPYPEVTKTSFKEIGLQHKAQGRVQTLKALWQSYGLGAFDKIEFANHYAEAFKLLNQRRSEPLPPAMRELINTIAGLRQHKNRP